MNTPRFLHEYANYKKREFRANKQMNKGIKAEGIRRIDLWEKAVRREICTVDEAMRMISHVFFDGENLEQYWR